MRFLGPGRVPLILIFGLAMILSACAPGSPSLPLPFNGSPFQSNGQQIYFTATSQRGTSISSDLRMGMMGGGFVACANCHGPDGHGGPVTIMMLSFDAPDIRYPTLTSDTMQDQSPFSDETIKRAITQGVDPAGNLVHYPMPRWTMSDADLNDLVAFLKTLK